MHTSVPTRCSPEQVKVFRTDVTLRSESRRPTSNSAAPTTTTAGATPTPAIKIEHDDRSPRTPRPPTTECVLRGKHFRRTCKVLCAFCSNTVVVTPKHIVQQQTASPSPALSRPDSWCWDTVDVSGQRRLVDVRGVPGLLAGTIVAVHRPFVDDRDPRHRQQQEQQRRRRHLPSVAQLKAIVAAGGGQFEHCLLYTSPSPRDRG